MGLWHWSFAINPVQTVLERWFQSLAESYPALSWMVAHPLLALISLLVLLAMIQILLGWISSGIKHLLFSIVKSPYFLVKWLLEKTTVPLGNSKTNFNKLSKNKIPEQVSTLLRRLDHHHREQEKLILELKTLLAHQVPELQPTEGSSNDLKSQSDTTTTNISSS